MQYLENTSHNTVIIDVGMIGRWETLTIYNLISKHYVIVNVQRVSPSGIPYTISVKQMLSPYGDEPRDQMWIKKRFDYWKRNF